MLHTLREITFNIPVIGAKTSWKDHIYMCNVHAFNSIRMMMVLLQMIQVCFSLISIAQDVTHIVLIQSKLETIPHQWRIQSQNEITLQWHFFLVQLIFFLHFHYEVKISILMKCLERIGFFENIQTNNWNAFYETDICTKWIIHIYWLFWLHWRARV